MPRSATATGKPDAAPQSPHHLQYVVGQRRHVAVVDGQRFRWGTTFQATRPFGIHYYEVELTDEHGMILGRGDIAVDSLNAKEVDQ